MKKFFCIVGAIASALAVFAAIAIIVKKVKFKFVISSADGEDFCDYDCDSCDEKCDAADDDEDFEGWDDIPVEEPEVEIEKSEDSVESEIEKELGKEEE